MILVFTGNGKGKTTAALGQAVRALGRGKRVFMIQFIKGPWKSGEDEFAEKFASTSDNFLFRKMGLGFVGILGDSLPREEHEKAARNALDFFKTELNKTEKGEAWDVMILDEINNAIALNLITVESVLDALKNVPSEKIVLLTGRDAPPEFIEIADLVTEMKEIKHPFAKGKMGKVIVEF